MRSRARRTRPSRNARGPIVDCDAPAFFPMGSGATFRPRAPRLRGAALKGGVDGFNPSAWSVRSSHATSASSERAARKRAAAAASLEQKPPLATRKTTAPKTPKAPHHTVGALTSSNTVFVTKRAPEAGGTSSVTKRTATCVSGAVGGVDVARAAGGVHTQETVVDVTLPT